jgi:hypothetical protein
MVAHEDCRVRATKPRGEVRDAPGKQQAVFGLRSIKRPMISFSRAS